MAASFKVPSSSSLASPNLLDGKSDRSPCFLHRQQNGSPMKQRLISCLLEDCIDFVGFANFRSKFHKKFLLLRSLMNYVSQVQAYQSYCRFVLLLSQANSLSTWQPVKCQPSSSFKCILYMAWFFFASEFCHTLFGI